MSEGPIGGARGSQELKGRRRNEKRREGGVRGDVQRRYIPETESSCIW